MKIFPNYSEDINNIKKATDENTILCLKMLDRIDILEKKGFEIEVFLMETRTNFKAIYLEINSLKDKLLLINPPSVQEFTIKISDLEFKMGKLWDLLTAKTPTGEVKASKTGRRFGGKLNQK